MPSPIYSNLLKVLPSGNTGVVARVSGEKIVEMLEVASSKWPAESASFAQVSGIGYYVNVQAEAGARVYNVQVINPETGYYEPIDLEKTYTVASTNLVLLEGEGGMTMFEGAEVVSNTGILDVEILEKYITEDLGGVIPTAYQRVTIHDSLNRCIVAGTKKTAQ